MQKTTKSERVIAYIFIAIVIFFFCFIILRVVTRQVFVKHFGMSNSIIDLIFFDADALNNVENFATGENDGEISINWQELYPFDGKVQTTDKDINDHKLLASYETIVKSVKNKIELYTTDFLPWYKKMAELANEYEKTLEWNIAGYTEYNGITQINGQYLASLSAEVDVSETAESTIEFAKYCKEKGIDFTYIQQPSKICMYEDENISGSTDYSNQNMDAFLEFLKKAGVDTYDHRIDIHSEGLNHHNLFYNTDHHWRAENGLWASQHILNYLNSQCGYNFDSSVLDSDNYTYDVYPDWFLGSEGKKVTLKVVDPDDFTLIYPNYKTFIHYQIPNLGIDEYGSFEITYDMECVDEIDYYNKNPYAAYNHADAPLILINNMMIDEGPRVLIIHNSFANCEIPFLAMSVKYLDAIDLRYFTGSIRNYIEQTNPNIVIVTYNGVADSVDWTTHTDVFDFR